MGMRLREGLGLLSGALAASAFGRPARAAQEMRIGYQKFGTAVLLKERGTLEPRLEALGIEVTWTEFPAGPQLLEALNVGAIDIGHTGEAPPIFAQAAGAPFVYVAVKPASPRSEALLVPEGSPITEVAQLRGTKVVLNKGSNVHYFLVRALEAHGLAWSDVTPVYLPPADARAAFEAGEVDAWAIWEPFLAAAEAATGARQLIDGTGLVANREFIEATRSFADAQPEAVRVFVEELDATDRWADADRAAAAAQTAPRVGIPARVLLTALSRMSFGFAPMSDEVAADQQKIADTFQRLGLVPKSVTIHDALWKAQS